MRKVVLNAAFIAASLLLLCTVPPLSYAAVSYESAVRDPSSVEAGQRTENGSVKTLYQKYENNPDVITVYVSSAMFELFRSLNLDVKGSVQVDGADGPADVDTGDLMLLFEVASSLTGLYILSTEDSVTSAAMRQDIRLDGEYRQLMKVKEGGDNVDFYYKSPDGVRIVEFLMVAGSDGETVVIQFESDSLTFEDVAKLAATVAQGS